MLRSHPAWVARRTRAGEAGLLDRGQPGGAYCRRCGQRVTSFFDREDGAGRLTRSMSGPGWRVPGQTDVVTGASSAGNTSRPSVRMASTWIGEETWLWTIPTARLRVGPGAVCRTDRCVDQPPIQRQLRYVQPCGQVVWPGVRHIRALPGAATASSRTHPRFRPGLPGFQRLSALMQIAQLIFLRCGRCHTLTYAIESFVTGIGVT